MQKPRNRVRSESRARSNTLERCVPVLFMTVLFVTVIFPVCA
jgi:hypothetical protein